MELVSHMDKQQRPRGVTVSTLDSESSDRGSNPREAYDVYILLFLLYDAQA